MELQGGTAICKHQIRGGIICVSCHSSIKCYDCWCFRNRFRFWPSGMVIVEIGIIQSHKNFWDVIGMHCSAWSGWLEGGSSPDSRLDDAKSYIHVCYICSYRWFSLFFILFSLTFMCPTFLECNPIVTLFLRPSFSRFFSRTHHAICCHVFSFFSKTVIVRGALYIFWFRDPTPSQRKNSGNSTGERGVAMIFISDHFHPRFFRYPFFVEFFFFFMSSIWSVFERWCLDRERRFLFFFFPKY